MYTLFTDKNLKAGSFKIYLCVTVFLVTVCTVGYVCLFRRDQTGVAE